MRRKGPLVRVLCFHDVDDAVWFESVIKMLLQNHNVLTPYQFHANDFDVEKINILLSFDDGYQSWIDTCLPVLERYDCKGLFFINSGLLDSVGDLEQVDAYMQNRLRISSKSPLTWQGAEALLVSGHSIGGHTITHPDLTSLPEEEVCTEVQDDKRRAESMLAVELKDFAYPFGTQLHYNDSIAKTATVAGYQYIYTAETGFYDNNITSVPRTLVEHNQVMSSLCHWIEGGYDIFRALKI